MTQTATSVTPTVNRVSESDIIAHIEDTRLYWIFRNGRQLQRSWNELTATEKRYQEEAAARASYVESFDIY